MAAGGGRGRASPGLYARIRNKAGNLTVAAERRISSSVVLWSYRASPLPSSFVHNLPSAYIFRLGSLIAAYSACTAARHGHLTFPARHSTIIFAPRHVPPHHLNARGRDDASARSIHIPKIRARVLSPCVHLLPCAGARSRKAVVARAGTLINRLSPPCNYRPRRSNLGLTEDNRFLLRAISRGLCAIAPPRELLLCSLVRPSRRFSRIFGIFRIIQTLDL